MIVESIALASFALQAGSAIGRHIGQNRAHRANVRAADASYLATAGDIAARLGEETRAAYQMIDRGGVQAQASTGTARASAAASGVGGRSIDLLLQDIERDRLGHRASVTQNLEAIQRQATRSLQGAQAARQSQIAGIPSANPWATGLEIGGAALEYGSDQLLLRNRNRG